MYNPQQTTAEIYAAFEAKESGNPAFIGMFEMALQKALVIIGGPAALDELRRQQAGRG